MRVPNLDWIVDLFTDTAPDPEAPNQDAGNRPGRHDAPLWSEMRGAWACRPGGGAPYALDR